MLLRITAMMIGHVSTHPKLSHFFKHAAKVYNETALSMFALGIFKFLHKSAAEFVACLSTAQRDTIQTTQLTI
jgi:hypothetical protein